MTDEATAVMPQHPCGGDGIFNRAAALSLAENRSLNEDEETLHMLTMTGGLTANKQFEQLVADVDMDKLKESLFNDYMAKMKAQIVNSPKSDGIARPRLGRDEFFTSQSNLGVMPNTSQRRQYQATVEDDAEDVSRLDKHNLDKDSRPELYVDTHQSNSPRTSPASSVISDVSSAAYVVGSPGSTASQGTSPKSRPRVRFSDRPPPVVVHGRGSDTEQPPRREIGLETTVEEPALSAVDLKWGKLFEEKGQPTKRLQVVLRSLANYMIAEFSPRDSLVITPSKLYTFYRKYKLEVEYLEFHHLFDNRTKAFNSLGQLYKSLGCDFHLVQEGPGYTPDIPALTPAGFVKWQTTLIQAFPDEEARRLHNVVAGLPIETGALAVDGKPERLPKQLSRHLFPAQRVDNTFYDLAQVVIAWREAMGFAETASSPKVTSSVRETSTRGSKGDSRTQDRDAEIEVPRRRSGAHYRESDRKPASKGDDASSRRYWSRRPSRLEQTPPAPSPAARSARQRSPPSSTSRYRRELGRTASEDGGNHRPSSASISARELAEQQRRTREDEYRLAQGRDRWGSLDSAPRGGGTGATGGGGNRRRSVVVLGPQEEGNPTYEELFAEKGM